MDDIERIIKRKTLSSRIVNQSFTDAEKILDNLIEEEMLEPKAGKLISLEYLKKADSELKTHKEMIKAAAVMTVFTPIGLFGFNQGFGSPDLDISMLGIGKHRYFLFHSAIGLAVLRYFYKLYSESDKSNEIIKKLGGAILGSYALAVGIHLTIDVFQPKSVVFPFVGSLVNGTLIDDNIWLMGNALWAFKISKDVFILAFGKELDTVKEFVKEKYEGVEKLKIENREVK